MIEQVRCDCGKSARLEVPEELTEPFKESLRRVGGMCDDCQRKEQEREKATARRRMVDQFRRRAGDSGIPRNLRNIRFEDLEFEPGNREAMTEARRWSQRTRDGLVLTGTVGTGKTTIAAAASWQQLVRGKLRWTSMPRVFALLGNDKDEASQKAAADLQIGSGALVLDDLDKARPTAYGASVVFGLIDHRVAEGEPLLITMNLTYAQLALHFPEPYGEAITSRLVGYCGDAIAVRGDDRRVPPRDVELPGAEA